MARLASALAALGGALGLSACGFTPLYGTAGLSPALSSIEVVRSDQSAGPADRADYVVHERVYYLLREQLDEELARDLGAPARYHLAYTIVEQRYPRGIRVNNVATRYEIDLTVRYSLTDAATGKVLQQGSEPVQVSYASADPPFAGVMAEQDAEERAANQAAVQIRLALSRYFARLASQ